MRTGVRIAVFLAVGLAAFGFTIANSREMVTVDLLLFRLRASLPFVVLGSVLVGMVAVFLVGLRADLRTRRMLQRYRSVMHGAESPPLAWTPEPSEEERSESRARLESADPS
ncbi:MAG: LapA family protein [Gemmatimonadota bacterium]